MDLQISRRLTIPATELSWRFSRSSGPGGQHVNTADTRVQLSWNVTTSESLSDEQCQQLITRLGHRFSSGALTVTVSEYRSQHRNRERALDKLAHLIRTALAETVLPRRSTRPSAGSKRRHIAVKKRRSDIKRSRQRPTAE